MHLLQQSKATKLPPISSAKSRQSTSDGIGSQNNIMGASHYSLNSNLTTQSKPPTGQSRAAIMKAKQMSMNGIGQGLQQSPL